MADLMEKEKRVVAWLEKNFDQYEASTARLQNRSAIVFGGSATAFGLILNVAGLENMSGYPVVAIGIACATLSLTASFVLASVALSSCKTKQPGATDWEDVKAKYLEREERITLDQRMSDLLDSNGAASTANDRVGSWLDWQIKAAAFAIVLATVSAIMTRLIR